MLRLCYNLDRFSYICDYLLSYYNQKQAQISVSNISLYLTTYRNWQYLHKEILTIYVAFYFHLPSHVYLKFLIGTVGTYKATYKQTTYLS